MRGVGLANVWAWFAFYSCGRPVYVYERCGLHARAGGLCVGMACEGKRDHPARRPCRNSNQLPGWSIRPRPSTRESAPDSSAGRAHKHTLLSHMCTVLFPTMTQATAEHKPDHSQPQPRPLVHQSKTIPTRTPDLTRACSRPCPQVKQTSYSHT